MPTTTTRPTDATLMPASRRRGRAQARGRDSTSCSPTPPSGAARAASSSRAPSAAVGAGVARHPLSVARRASALGTELARVATGRSQQAPAKGDRRFADQAWERNWLLRRVMQGYLAVGETVDGVISDAQLDWQTERQARFAASNVLDALAPTNFPWSNPAVLRAIVDEGGANLVRGGRRFAADVSWPPRLPQSVDTEGFEVGSNLAVSPGSVVLRTEVFELIQYKPTTAKVREVPLLLVPPTINKYYILDLAPGRSMVEYLVASGQQVFVISWRNPDEAQGHFDLDTYADAVLEARQAVADITRQSAVHLNAACSGGIITRRDARSPRRRADPRRCREPDAVRLCAGQRACRHRGRTDESRNGRGRRGGVRPARLPRRTGAGRGVRVAAAQRHGLELRRQQLPARQASRPPSTSCTGTRTPCASPPACTETSSAWRSTTRWHTPATSRCWARRSTSRQVELDTLHRRRPQGPHRAVGERLRRHAAARRREALRAVDQRPHPGARQPTRGRNRAPATASRRAPEDPQAFIDQSAKLPGSWWPDYVEWLEERSGDLRPAPKRLGGGGRRALGKAPGTYVFAK